MGTVPTSPAVKIQITGENKTFNISLLLVLLFSIFRAQRQQENGTKEVSDETTPPTAHTAIGTNSSPPSALEELGRGRHHAKV